MMCGNQTAFAPPLLYQVIPSHIMIMLLNMMMIMLLNMMVTMMIMLLNMYNDHDDHAGEYD